jgi:hypothetical protein
MNIKNTSAVPVDKPLIEEAAPYPLPSFQRRRERKWLSKGAGGNTQRLLAGAQSEELFLPEAVSPYNPEKSKYRNLIISGMPLRWASHT